MFLWLVVLAGVDGVFGEDFAGGAVDDEGVGAVDEDEYRCVAVASADGEVVEFSGVADGDDSCGIDVVEADAVVASCDRDGGAGFGGGVVALCGGVPA